MVRANRRWVVALLVLGALALPSASAFAECSNLGPAQVGDCPAPTPASQSGGSSGSASPADAKGAGGRFYSLVNSERSSRGLGSLARNSQLERIALGHARRMAKAGRVYHNDELFSPSTVAALGNPSALGENVGRGSSVEGLHRAFMQSRAHRTNILDGDYGQAGFAVVYASGQLWVVETFMSPTGRAPRVWAGGSDDVARSRAITFSGPALGAWRWTAPPADGEVAVPLVQTQEVAGVRETLKSVPGGAAGLAFALAFLVVLGAALPRARNDEDYV